MMTVFEFQARMIERIGETLAHWLQTTAPDKQGWKPSIEGSVGTRSAMEQVQECIIVNRSFAAKFRGEEAPLPDENAKSPELTPEQAQEQLIASAKELAGVIRGLDEEALTREYTLPWAKVPGAILMELALMNMAYHGGQINLIQMLCGDKEFHVNPSFFNI